MSRPDHEVRDQLQDPSQDTGARGIIWTDYKITLEDNSSDLKCFAQNIMNVRVRNRDLELRQESAADAAVKADGMFLWIKLLHRQLSRSKSPARLRKIITDTPSGLDQAYERDLVSIVNLDVEERDRAVAILRWTLFAFRPLTVRQLSEALLVEFKDDGESDDEERIAKRNYNGLSQAYGEESGTSDESGSEEVGNYLRSSEVDVGDDDSLASEFLKNCGSLIELRGGDCLKAKDRTIHFVHFSGQRT